MGIPAFASYSIVSQGSPKTVNLEICSRLMIGFTHMLSRFPHMTASRRGYDSLASAA